MAPTKRSVRASRFEMTMTLHAFHAFIMIGLPMLHSSFHTARQMDRNARPSVTCAFSISFNSTIPFSCLGGYLLYLILYPGEEAFQAEMGRYLL